MAGLPTPLVGSARYFFRAMVPSFIRADMSSGAMIRAARTAGFSYRRTNMLRDIREFTGLMRHEAAVRATVSDRFISRGAMTEIDLKRDYRYRGFADATYRNVDTGDLETKMVSFYDDELRTEDDWSKLFDDWRVEAESRIEYELVDFKMRALEHQAGWAY